MKVFKFGGASLKHASGFRNVASIIRLQDSAHLLVVVSAIGSTTNALEQAVALAQATKNFTASLVEIEKSHLQIVRDLGLEKTELTESLKKVFHLVKTEVIIPDLYDEVYDQVVSQGEILSSLILNQLLQSEGVDTVWIDARKYINTNSDFREGKVDWNLTSQAIQPLKSLVTHKTIITQGFIGSNNERTVTLGRDGSDYSAAIFASCLQADSVTIWKDVPGVMSADPNRLSSAVVFEELPYQEAAEMTYYGASVIHPKTIKPLANKGIPLWVKNFDDTTLPGTVIHECRVSKLPPLIVFKDHQCLVSCRVTDYSFINEKQMGTILDEISRQGIRINVMQNSAITFSFCVDFQDQKVLKLIDTLSKDFDVYYNTGLTLITIKNYDTPTFLEYRSKAGVVLEQSSRSTLQVLIKN